MPVMLDLETMGNGPHAAIVAIGAVEFAPETGRSFYVQVGLEDSAKFGDIDASTVLWWLEQNRAARKELFTGQRENLSPALLAFADWYEGCQRGSQGEGAEVWGNGAAFDNVILRSAYARAGLLAPWPFWLDRCFRTMKALHPHIAAPAREGTHPNGLDDARHQAAHLTLILGV